MQKAVTALAVLNAERIKLSTIRSPLWSAVLAAVLSLGVAALQGSSAYGAAGLAPESAVTGVAVFGIPVLMILSAMVVTGEYRTGMIRTTFAASPNRTLVLVAKAVTAAVCSGAVRSRSGAGRSRGGEVDRRSAVSRRQLSLAAPGMWRVVGAVALYAALTAVLGVAVGALLAPHRGRRRACCCCGRWWSNPVLGNLPDLGTEVGPYLPFANAFVFTEVPWLFPVYAMPWGPIGSLAYFVAVTAFLFVAATVVVNRRDA